MNKIGKYSGWVPFEGRANISDPITKLTRLIVLLHWATPDCMNNTDGPNRIDIKQGIIRALKRSFPSSLNNEAGNGYLSEDQFDALAEKIVVHDFHLFVALSKIDFEGQADKLLEEIGVERDEYELLCTLVY